MYKIFPTNKKGFTLVELIVVVSIMTIISAVIFWNGRAFNDKITVTSAAEDASLAIREAQNYGVSVKGTASGQFNLAYGVSFDTSNISPAPFIPIFADANGNGRYDSSEEVDRAYLRNGVTITKLCVVNSTSASTCSGIQSIQAIFVRPNLNATINAFNSSGVSIGGPWVSGQITLQSPQGNTKVVSISFTGQVSVQ